MSETSSDGGLERSVMQRNRLTDVDGNVKSWVPPYPTLNVAVLTLTLTLTSLARSAPPAQCSCMRVPKQDNQPTPISLSLQQL
jgi:hypothetical protein